MCCCCCRGFYELTPLLNYLTGILQEVFFSNETSVYANQRRGQLNGTYVQTNPSLSSVPYATLKYPDAYLPVSAHLPTAMSEAVCLIVCMCACVPLPLAMLTCICQPAHIQSNNRVHVYNCERCQVWNAPLSVVIVHLVSLLIGLQDTTVAVTLLILQVDQPIRDPFVGVTESQCILEAKIYTITVANVDDTPPANVWNFCATGTCNYAFPNGTSGVFISSYAGSHTSSICQLGYSNAVDNNEYVVPAAIQSPGLGSAGKLCNYLLLKCSSGQSTPKPD